MLGEHAYGVAASVSATTETSLSAILGSRRSSHYFPSFKAAETVGISGRALGKITSSFMVITSDEQRTNVSLSL
ncbi:uncharacterized protein LACBIDRAFT_304208 [Laccaria bicolor S238N-H82]|uniref:Predicted protein n=1 Tax=Laccaria bicolor (strain S238N-H82 / ATCC MYA-4686) TaxID=486041 RepID=B0E4C5_LACBS|nr:uncharacterized protein LACBIDRAFT_304208 [Laccaria bicolor S238N-H82]EDQ98304.1 predicted protein [Laccaria bicolor S238N-H82]|eukprot:XP_001891043.1 predicted protein [Laccaria bicolor S238N-H82]